jgi:hypothetical protein
MWSEQRVQFPFVFSIIFRFLETQTFASVIKLVSNPKVVPIFQ